MLFCGTSFTFAFAEDFNEIQYARLIEVRGSDLLIRYDSPAGERHFVCNAETEECEQLTEEEPTLFPDIESAEGSAVYQEKL